MSLSITALVTGGLSICAVAGGIVGWVTHNRQERRRWAAQTWRDVTLRNGVTSPSPFHTPDSAMNAPGLVRVYPRSQMPKSPTPAATGEQLHTARPLPTSAIQSQPLQQVHTIAAPLDERSNTPLELSEPPHPDERARCRQLYQQGLSQTKLIQQVWGISKGGGRKYSEARRRFRQHVKDIATGDLLASIQAEENAANA